MNVTDDDLARMVAAEPTATHAPDLGAILTAGRRLRTRRRVVTGAVGLAVVGVLGLPAALVATHGTGGTPSPGPATSTPTSTPTVDRDTPAEDLSGPPRQLIPRGCGMLGCPRDAVPETGRVVGEPWLVAGLADGTEEVIYAVRPTPGSGLVVATGLRDEQGLRRLDLVLRPGRGPLQLSGGERTQGPDGASYLVVGLGKDATDVSWQSRPGTWYGAGQDDDLVPGHAVFWFGDEWDESWPADARAPFAVRIDGEVVHGG